MRRPSWRYDRLLAAWLILAGPLAGPLSALGAELPSGRPLVPELPASAATAARVPGAAVPGAPEIPAGAEPAQAALPELEAAAPQGASASAELDRLYSGGRRFRSGDEFDAAAAAWDAELLAAYRAQPGASFMPPSLPRIGRARREANRAHLYRTGRPVLETFGRFAQEAAHPGGGVHERTFGELLSSLAQSIRERYFGNVYAEKLGRKALERGIADMRGELAKSGVADVRAADIEDFVREYHAAVEGYRAEYGPEQFSDAAVRKAGFNAFAMHMFLSLTGQRFRNREAIYAMALLHPITDDALDSGQDMGRAMRKISGALRGEPQAPETPYERVVLDFIGTLFRAFPPKSHPMFQRALQRLQEEQLQSVRLQKAGASDASLELNTLRKGALTSLLFGYSAMGRLSNPQARFFYEAGFILQLIDDMLDVQRDLADGADTLWTRAWSRASSARSVLKRLLALQTGLESRSRTLLAGTPHGGRFADAFDYGFKLFMVSALFDPFKYRALSPVLADRLPLSASYLKTSVFTLADRLRAEPGTDLRLLEILDDGFLGGAYRLSRAGRAAKAPARFAIGGFGPKWWWIGAASFLQAWLRLIVTAKKDTAREPLAVFSMIGWGALYVFGMLSNMTALGLKDLGGVVIIATVLLFNMMGAWAVPVALGGLLLTTLLRLLS